MSDQIKSKNSKIIITVLYVLAIAFLLYSLSLLLFKKNITILYTHSLNGNLDGCSCPSQPKGGAVKRSFYLQEFRKKNNDILLIDGGDFSKPIKDDLVTGYILKAYEKMAYDVVGIGDQELTNGIEHFNQFIDQYPFFLSSNLIIDGKRTEEYVVKKVKNVKVGIFSLVDKGVFKFLKNDIKQKLIVEDPYEKAGVIVEKLKAEKVDLIILLSHLGEKKDKELAEKVEGIDLLLNGHDELYFDKRNVKKVADTYLLSAGDNGYRIGVLDLTLRNNKIVGVKNELFPIKSTEYEDDPEIREMINQYKADWQKRRESIKIEQK